MNIEAIRQLIHEAFNDAPVDVMCVCGTAADNAADVVGVDNRRVNGEFTEAFCRHWVGSVESILSYDVSSEVREWYKIRGIQY